MSSYDHIESNFERLNLASDLQNDGKRKTGPSVPPKPYKNYLRPEIPKSSYVGQACKPLYSQRLQFSDNKNISPNEEKTMQSLIIEPTTDPQVSLLQRKKAALFSSQNVFDNDVSKVTLDNPAILEQQLEVLAHHKKQLERKGLLPKQSLHNNIPKLSSTSLASKNTEVTYANVLNMEGLRGNSSSEHSNETSRDNTYSNVNAHKRYFENIQTALAAEGECVKPIKQQTKIYSNINYDKNERDNSLQRTYGQQQEASAMSEPYLCCKNQDDMQPPPSPVSSSYSELRRANDHFSPKKIDNEHHRGPEALKAVNNGNAIAYAGARNYTNVKYKNDFGNQDSVDYYGVGGSFSQASSTYESIYEPINPRPPSQMSSKTNFLNYSSYVNNQNAHLANMSSSSALSQSSSLNLLSLNDLEASTDNISLYSEGAGNSRDLSLSSLKSESEVETLTNFLVRSMDGGGGDIENYGICFKCNERVLGESSGCTAMNQVYHIVCFTCSQCQINLQGKPFYALDGKPFCEYDYLQTLEKCSVCMKPILERILRAIGKPYHPQCFTCVVCGKSLDGIPFTVDATNQNYCIEDFHKKFAPRCCVCNEPIMPEPGEEETVRVVALDRSFHFECYKCEDCGLLLSSEAEGRGCYPLDDHVLCKSCNAKRVQLLTNCITTAI